MTYSRTVLLSRDPKSMAELSLRLLVAGNVLRVRGELQVGRFNRQFLPRFHRPLVEAVSRQEH